MKTQSRSRRNDRHDHHRRPSLFGHDYYHDELSSPTSSTRVPPPSTLSFGCPMIQEDGEIFHSLNRIETRTTTTTTIMRHRRRRESSSTAAAAPLLDKRKRRTGLAATSNNNNNNTDATTPTSTTNVSGGPTTIRMHSHHHHHRHRHHPRHTHHYLQHQLLKLSQVMAICLLLFLSLFTPTSLAQPSTLSPSSQAAAAAATATTLLASTTTTTATMMLQTTPSSVNLAHDYNNNNGDRDTRVMMNSTTTTTTTTTNKSNTSDDVPQPQAATTMAHKQANNNHIAAIEQVAKAEALTAESNGQQQQQQHQSVKYDVCKLQSKVGLNLTNLSQIIFHPSDICSSWTKMQRSPPPLDQSAQYSDQYPWYYIERLDLSANNLTALHDSSSSGMSRLVSLLELKITHNQLSRCEESSLVGLQRLQTLDLSHNKLNGLPARFFQHIRATLKKLNLSFNSISVLVPNLFDSLNQLEYLDLSHNDITSHWISDKLFKNLTQLRYLDLSFNKLTVFSSPQTFSSLQQLETLSLQHNELRQVPETIQYLRYLSSLDLSQNYIHDIQNASYLSNCHLLFNLNLESNQLENITRDAFSDLPALKVLNLANNRISHLDGQAFDYVPDLHALRLDSNRLIDFGQAFVNLRFLLMLNVSSNRITSFDYAQIPLGLQWLDLHSNRIDKLNNFYYSPRAQQEYSAQALALTSSSASASNDIQQQQQQQPTAAGSSIGQQWQSMLRLTTLDASHNLIRELDNTSLPESLETVQLNNNHIRTIASHTFSTKSNLSRINLSHNQLASLPLDAFRLHNNHHPHSHRSGGANNNNNYAASSQDQSINPSSTSTSTTSTSSSSSSSSGGGGGGQQKFFDIYLANNPFVCNCNMGWLSQLLLASSWLIGHSGHSNQLMSNTGGHHISPQLPRDHTLTSTYHSILGRQLPRVVDAHLVNCHLPFARPTPYTADPHQWSPIAAANQLAATQMQLQQQHHHHHHHSNSNNNNNNLLPPHSSGGSKLSPPTSQQQQQPDVALILRQSELLASVHLCSYKSHCFALCFCCDFDACDCKMSCPENCSCYYDQTWSTNIVDCSANNQINAAGGQQPTASVQSRFAQMMMGAGASTSQFHRQQQQQQPLAGQLVKFTSIPEKIPMDVTELYLDGLELLHLQGNALIGRRNLKSLYLNASQLHSIGPKALITQKALRILQLNSNYLTELHGYEFEQQVELRELYLANNQLSSIANNTFAPLRSLQILHLQNNQLYQMNFWTNLPHFSIQQPQQQQLVPSQRQQQQQLISINLGSNPWSCQCDYVEPMLEWLQVNQRHLYNRKSITCQYNATSALHLLAPIVGSGSGSLADIDPSAATNVVVDRAMLLSSSSASSLENYPMFEASKCLNYTVYPSAIQQLQQPASTQSSIIMQQYPFVDPNANQPVPELPSSGPDQIVGGPNYQVPPNDEPLRPPPPAYGGPGNQLPMMPSQQPPPPAHTLPHDQQTLDDPLSPGYQFPPNPPYSTPLSSGSRSTPTSSAAAAGATTGAQLLSPYLLLVALAMLLLLVVTVLPLIHYRRSMRTWFYSNYGLSMFSGAKGQHHQAKHPHHHHHHHHGIVGSLTSKHQGAAAHLHHQYGASSAASTSSSSAASSNLSQALQHQQNNNTNGHHHHLQQVTTPLIMSQQSSGNSVTYSAANEDSKLFDAYVTYSKLDEQFVNDFIAPELEYGQPSYRIALHYRDLPATTTTSEFLTDCIIETANASRRIIMIISEQLLRTEWQRYEFRAAHLETLRNQPKSRLIVVLLGQPALTQQLLLADQELANWLKSCTCIHWGDKMFWPRLRFALPEVAAERHLRQQQAQQQAHASVRYQSLAAASAEQQQQSRSKSSCGLGANLLRSTTGLFGGGGGGGGGSAAAASQPARQQLVAASRPLPRPSQQQHQQHQQDFGQQQQQEQAQEHHYAHLTPATMMIYQQAGGGGGAASGQYHPQPLYGEPGGQPTGSGENPVHI